MTFDCPCCSSWTYDYFRWAGDLMVVAHERVRNPDDVLGSLTRFHSSDGTVLWTVDVPVFDPISESTLTCYDVKIDSAGLIYAAFWGGSSVGGVMQVDNDGNIQWIKALSDASASIAANRFDEAHPVVIDIDPNDDGRIYLGHRPIDSSGEVVTRFDASGNVTGQWKPQAAGSPIDVTTSHARALSVDQHGKVWISGKPASTSNLTSMRQFPVLRFDPDVGSTIDWAPVNQVDSTWPAAGTFRTNITATKIITHNSNDQDILLFADEEWVPGSPWSEPSVAESAWAGQRPCAWGSEPAGLWFNQPGGDQTYLKQQWLMGWLSHTPKYYAAPVDGYESPAPTPDPERPFYIGRATNHWSPFFGWTVDLPDGTGGTWHYQPSSRRKALSTLFLQQTGRVWAAYRENHRFKSVQLPCLRPAPTAPTHFFPAGTVTTYTDAAFTVQGTGNYVEAQNFTFSLDPDVEASDMTQPHPPHVLKITDGAVERLYYLAEVFSTTRARIVPALGNNQSPDGVGLDVQYAMNQNTGLLETSLVGIDLVAGGTRAGKLGQLSFDWTGTGNTTENIADPRHWPEQTGNSTFQLVSLRNFDGILPQHTKTQTPITSMMWEGEIADIAALDPTGDGHVLALAGFATGVNLSERLTTPHFVEVFDTLNKSRVWKSGADEGWPQVPAGHAVDTKSLE